MLWLNPLAGGEGYEPLVGGMVVAQRHVWALLPARTPDDFVAAAAALRAANSVRESSPRRANQLLDQSDDIDAEGDSA